MQSPQQIPQMMMMTGMAGAPLGMEQQGVWQVRFSLAVAPSGGCIPLSALVYQPMLRFIPIYNDSISRLKRILSAVENLSRLFYRNTYRRSCSVRADCD